MKNSYINQGFTCNNCPLKNSHKCFILEFWTGVDRGKFIGTKEEIYNQIDSYEWKGFKRLSVKNRKRMITNIADILKNGYFNEFKDKPYSNSNMVIDNGLHIIITRVT